MPKGGHAGAAGKGFMNLGGNAVVAGHLNAAGGGPGQNAVAAYTAAAAAQNALPAIATAIAVAHAAANFATAVAQLQIALNALAVPAGYYSGRAVNFDRQGQFGNQGMSWHLAIRFYLYRFYEFAYPSRYHNAHGYSDVCLSLAQHDHIDTHWGNQVYRGTNTPGLAGQSTNLLRAIFPEFHL
jgi:hypothetical protein